MTIPRDYYEVLGVPRDADTTTIKDAFRKLARRYHPDISTEPDAEQRFREIAEAYGVLSDPAKRASYDVQGSAGLAGATAEDLWGGIDFADIFGPGAGAFGSLIWRLFRPSAAAAQPGGDVHLDLIISLEEVLTGRNHAVTIRIPPGIPEGATLRLAGRGMPGPVPGGPPGDAYVRIRTRADPRFTREGADLWSDLHIQAPDAALGVTAAVPALQGQARVWVPSGIQPGSVLRVEGRGLPRYEGHGRGSLNLTVILDIPRQLSSRQKELYEQLRAEDAGIGSTVGRSSEPTAPLSSGRMTADAGGRHAGGRGMLVLTPVLLLVTAVFNLVGGIAAIAGSHILIASVPYLSGGLRAWGSVMAILSAVQLLATAGVWAGSQLARWLAVVAVGLSAIGQTFVIPAYPLWSLVIIAADVVALWGLYAFGLDGDGDVGRRR